MSITGDNYSSRVVRRLACRCLVLFVRCSGSTTAVVYIPPSLRYRLTRARFVSLGQSLFVSISFVSPVCLLASLPPPRPPLLHLTRPYPPNTAASFLPSHLRGPAKQACGRAIRVSFRVHVVQLGPLVSRHSSSRSQSMPDAKEISWVWCGLNALSKVQFYRRLLHSPCKEKYSGVRI